ncbi:hypothetical protein [Methylobacterium aquaticum]|uniref:hypothetical protein n=1 Tax=Methylobacterium aquaticum TaxID=270351 RepID=UPI00193370F3|nr:hypothetical protein [Methylobacterium aquaticum]QRE74095.1 hypothetical protein F1D61_11120 [Methylobacterium aquaticum]
MGMLARHFAGLLGRVRSTDMRQPDAAAPYEPRPMTSFLGSLSAEQMVKLKAYAGEEKHGEDRHRRPLEPETGRFV